MSETTFREASSGGESKPQAETPEVKNPDRPEGGGPTPIALYSELEGKPYSAKFFEVEDIYKESESLAEELDFIDRYYREKVQRGELEDGKKTYKNMIKEAEKATDTKNAGNNLKIAKISAFLKYMGNLKKIDKEHDRWA